MPRLLLALVTLLASLAALGGEARLHRYTVSIDPELTLIRVRACFEGAPPRQLVAASLDAAGVLVEAHFDGVRKSLEPNGAELRLTDPPGGGCLNYGVHVGSAQKRHQRGTSPLRRVGGDLVTDLGLWLWRPALLEAGEDIEVRFDLPDGVSVSAPWKPVRDDAGRIVAYRVGHAPYDWPASLVFGSFAEEEIDVAGARLRVATLHGSPAVEPELVREWLTRSAQAVATLYGRFPAESVQITVTPSVRGPEAVPWAYVLRGGMPSVHFFINQRKPLEEFLSDWTAVHELSHLLLPYVRPEDAWLAEGTASYYQNVLRARAGMIPAADAWQRLHSGFRRGMRSMPGVTLAAATERMYRDGAYMRVYWEGAALMLLADRRLRERSGGEQSLDLALARLQECCLAPDEAWHARALFEQLDRITGTQVFSELYEEHVASDAFPDLSETYAALGLAVDASGNGVEMLAHAPEIAARDAIMTPHRAAQ
jgi:hypothetical protein